MRRASFIALLLTSACGQAPVSVEVQGAPPASVLARVRAFQHFAGDERALRGVIDVRPLNAFARCPQTHTASECPNTEGNAELFYVTTDAASLPHELTHVLFGDREHTRDELWGFAGLVRHFLAAEQGVSVEQIP